MKALIYYGNKDIRIEDIQIPNHEANEVLIEVAYTSICATDIEEWQYGPLWVQTGQPNSITGRMAPLVLGHEIGGRVDSIGARVDKSIKGSRVAINNILTCGTCYWCVKGKQSVCPNLAVAGFSADGGLQEYMKWPATHVVPIPETISDKEISLAEPTTVAIHAVRKSGVKPGDITAVIGCGTVGLLTIQTLCASGSEVIAIDIRENSLKKASELGAAHVVNIANDLPLDEPIKELTHGIGPAIVFETAGAANTPGIAINICQRGGTVVLVGIYSNKPSFDFNQIVGQEKKVLGSVATSPGDLAHAIKLIGDGRIKLKPLISDVVPLSNVINEGFNRMLTKNKDIYRILVDPKN